MEQKVVKSFIYILNEKSDRNFDPDWIKTADHIMEMREKKNAFCRCITTKKYKQVKDNQKRKVNVEIFSKRQDFGQAHTHTQKA